MYFFGKTISGISLSIILLGLSLSPSLAQFHIQNFGIAEGLPQSQVQSMTEDDQGYLWLGTLGGGLSRFDGQTFETFTTNDGLINNVIWDVFIDPDHHVWSATSKGISMFDGVQFRNIKVSQHEGVYVNKIFASGKDIMYVMFNGEFGKVWYDSVLHSRTLGIISNLNSIHKSVSGYTFVIHNVKERSDVVVFGPADSLELKNVAFTTIYTVFVQEGRTLISSNVGLFRFDGNQLSVVSDVKIPLYAFDDNSKSFVGTNNSRLVTVDTHFKIKSEMDSVNYLILSSLKDSEGNLWLGTDQSLFEMHPYSFVNPLEGRGRQDAVLTICDYRDQLWIGTTYRGIKAYHNNRLVQIYDLGGKTRNYVNVIKKDGRGRLWVGTLGGIAFFENNKFKWQYPDIVTNAVALEFDREDNFLVGGAQAGMVSIINGKAYKVPEFNLIGVWCIKYNPTHDYFVIGTNVGLKMFNKGKISTVDIEELNVKEISALDWLDSDNLIIGTFGEGMYIYSFASGALRKIDYAGGLASNTLFFVYHDYSGIWVGTEKGIDRIRYDLAHHKILRIDHFDDTDGLLGLESNLNAVYRKDSVLLFGLVKGLYRFQEKHNVSPENKIHLKGVSVFYKPYHEGRLRQGFDIDSSAVYSFGYNQNHLTLLYNKVNKQHSKKYFYTYKLQDFDQIWSKPSSLKSVTYSNLSPGLYTLKLKATDRSGEFIFDKTQFHFRIIPAFYQTTWFKLTMALLALLLITGMTYFMYRIRAIRVAGLQLIKDNEKTRLRKQIARDFHDEMGNQVARMINYVGLLRVSEKIEKDIYQTLNDYSQIILSGAKDFVWALDPKNDDLQSVLIHLKDFGERMFSEKNTQFSFFGDLQNIKLPMGYGRQINLIFKEAMTNAFKHSSAKSVDFSSTRVSTKELSISLKDDGIGINSGEIENSERGIENMRLRAMKIGSALEIYANGEGTVVRLMILIPEAII